MGSFSDSQFSLVVSVICIYILYIGAWTLHSVYLGPLAKFPGPKLAAATLWYEFYYDVFLFGQYTFKIKELHNQYGPIIRISPYELHIDDPDYYDELYSQHKPRNKYQFFVNQLGLYGSAFATVDHKHHRLRRAAMNPFFSKQAVYRLQPMLHFMIGKLCGRIEEHKLAGQPIPMRRAYMCLATDIITLYALNHSWNRLDDPGFSQLWVDTVKATLHAGHFLKQFPIMHTILNAVPMRILGAINPGMGLLLQWRKEMQDETKEVIDGNYKSSQEQLDLGLQKTIFNELLESDLPPEEKLHSRLWQEGLVVVGAGSDTTAFTLTVIHFWLLEKPELLMKLRTELETAMPDKFEQPELSAIEKLPYINAIINEGLRLSYGVCTRLQRSSPTEVMKFHDWEIPAGVSLPEAITYWIHLSTSIDGDLQTPVGMTSVDIHHNKTIFPDSHEFKPERWLEKRPAGAPPLEKYLVSFSRGSRQCVGMNLAKAELYLTIATIFRRYEHQELFETSRMDVELKHDMFVPQPDMSSKGVGVLFK